MKRKVKVLVVIAIVAIVMLSVLIVLQPFNERKKDAKIIIKSINKASKLDNVMIVTNFQYTYVQNGKTNKTVTQGVYSSLDNKKNVLLKGDIEVTSTLNQSNNFTTSFDLIKKGKNIFEKKGAQYVPSSITPDEFSKMTDEFKIYNFKYKEVKDIKKTVSIDRSQTVYEVSLKKIPDKLLKDYVESINSATSEEFTAKDLKVLSCSLISNVSKSILKSQQLRILIEAKSKTNVIQIGFISEIDIIDDKAQIVKIFEDQEEF